MQTNNTVGHGKQSGQFGSKEYVSTREAADMLGVTVRTVQNWVDGGKLGARVTLGGHRRVFLGDVEALLAKSDMPSVNTAAVGKDAQRLRLVVLEDNSELLEMYRLRLSLFRVPHDLYLAQDALTGLFMVGHYAPHLLLMDLRMPGVDGFAFLRTLQSRPEASSMKIIVVTGLGAAEVIEGGGLPSGVALLPKPVPFEILETLCVQRAAELGLALSSET